MIPGESTGAKQSSEFSVQRSDAKAGKIGVVYSAVFIL
jgi:hypothetical protein